MSMTRETTGSCDSYLQHKEECCNIKRDPHLRPISERIKKWEESKQRRATAAGFASIDEYHRHKHSKDLQMCRIAYENYKEPRETAYFGACSVSQSHVFTDLSLSVSHGQQLIVH